MDSIPKLSREEFIARMQSFVAQALGQVADAINDAAPGSMHPPGYIVYEDSYQVVAVPFRETRA